LTLCKTGSILSYWQNSHGNYFSNKIAIRLITHTMFAIFLMRPLLYNSRNAVCSVPRSVLPWFLLRGPWKGPGAWAPLPTKLQELQHRTASVVETALR
jgi:hypothetical protein